jgi:GR25 family glycosyltransferase involved in LPS biosynthesis
MQVKKSFKHIFNLVKLLIRYIFKISNKNLNCKNVSVSQIPIFFINLSNRVDRLNQCNQEFSNLGLIANRFNAYSHPNGAIGCANSHYQLLKSLANSKQPVMICEDDIEFLASRAEIDLIIKDFMNNTKLDILCLANISKLPFAISRSLAISFSIQTTACYLIKPRSISFLMEIALESRDHLLKNEAIEIFAYDQHWKHLQSKKLIFAVPRKLVCKQRKSYSDIQNKFIDYYE